MNEFLHTMSLVKVELPGIELIGLLIIMSMALVFRFPRTGLVAAYIFIYRWGWSVIMGCGTTALAGYMVFGMCVGILSVIAFLNSSQ